MDQKIGKIQKDFMITYRRGLRRRLDRTKIVAMTRKRTRMTPVNRPVSEGADGAPAGWASTLTILVDVNV